MEHIVTALDLGSSSIKVVVGHVEGLDEIEIIGCGTYTSDINLNPGIKTGSIINIDSAIKGIVDAVSEAELMSGVDIDSVLVNITGRTMQSGNSKGTIAITNRDKNITESDVMRVIEASQKSIRLPNDQTILHVISKEFIIDNQRNIKDPLGMNGIRLEADVHMITGGKVTVSSIEKTVRSSGLKIIDLTLSSIASSEAVLASTEKDIGVIVIDIGASVCDIIMYLEGGIVFSAIIPFGGSHITSDLAIGLKTSLEHAENIKKIHGHVLLDSIDSTETIQIPSFNGREGISIYREDVIRIIEPRMREIFEMIHDEIIKSGKKRFMSGGVILTGGGSLLNSIEVLAEAIFDLPTIKAKPANISGLTDKVASPEFSTSVGLIKYYSRLMGNLDNESKFKRPNTQGLSKRIINWIEEHI